MTDGAKGEVTAARKSFFQYLISHLEKSGMTRIKLEHKGINMLKNIKSKNCNFSDWKVTDLSRYEAYTPIITMSLMKSA